MQAVRSSEEEKLSRPADGFESGNSGVGIQYVLRNVLLFSDQPIWELKRHVLG